MVGRDQVDEGGKLLINERMIEELFGGDKITQQECKGDWKVHWEVEAEVWVERWMWYDGGRGSTTNVYAEM